MLKKNKLFFFVVGSLGFVIDYLVFSHLSSFFGFFESRTFSFIVSTAFCWLMNRRLSFGAPISKKITVEGFSYYVVTLMAAVMNISLSFYIVNRVGNDYVLIGIAIGCLIGAIFNFWALQKIVYKNAAV